MHQHLQDLQRLEHLSIAPWDAPPPSDVFQKALDDGADPNDYGKYDSISMPCTAAVLHHVHLGHLAEKDGVELIELLHRYGADHRLVTSDGDTSLHLAIRLGLPDTVDALRLHADPMAFNAAGKSALCYPLLQKALRRERTTDGKRHARAQRVLATMVDAAVKVGLPRPHKLLVAQEAYPLWDARGIIIT
ncbi:putative ankyrin repeat protein L88 [Madurella mycetomatis]|uniref:Ankyrin repeat protein L88 n=1 Tax=Madurella mycetomatis TaxID=100816 RepID=A0A175W9K5_9PEZI|nr:putative ankyrin repeat protein L88 [Madurella mycetomatis]